MLLESEIVVIGGAELLGSKLVERFRAGGHDPVAASLDTGLDTLTGDGLAEALEGAHVVVDLADATRRDDRDPNFFQTPTCNILAAERAASVNHHVTLSVVGADRVPESGYLRAKVAQGNGLWPARFLTRSFAQRSSSSSSLESATRVAMASQCVCPPWRSNRRPLMT
jgi:uncharacterized protein YbjT (DUF2867 family)